MKKLLFLFGFILLFSLYSHTQPRVIIDTDIDSDVDDVGAMAMLYNMHLAGKINLIGVIVTSDDPFAPTCIGALNTFYKMPDLPTGFLEEQEKLTNHSRYTRQLSEEFPGTLKSWKDTPTATETYRKLLAESPDNSVIIVSIGHLTSMRKLMESSPDGHSKFNGKQLIEKKVQKWYCMGGYFPEGKEANFYRPDPASTEFMIRNWTKDVVFCGWEIGNPVKTGGESVKTILPAVHPLYRAYELYNNFAGRASWDQLAILLLTGEAFEFFDVEQNGICLVHADGYNRWIPGRPTNHAYLKFKEGVDKNKIAERITMWMLGMEVR